MGRKSKTEGVTAHRGRIQLRFTWHGKEYRPTLELSPTKSNMNAAKRLREKILDEITRDEFDMRAHFPDFRGQIKNACNDETSVAPHLRDLKAWSEKHFEFRARSNEHSTQTVYMRHMNTYWISKWGHLLPRNITHEMIQKRLADLARGGINEDGTTQIPLSRKTQNNILIPLRGVFELICKGLPHLKNPTEGIENLEVPPPQPDPFTPKEVELILASLRNINSEIADYFEFAMFTGLRDSEQIALRWEDIDMVNMTMVIRRARVLGKSKPRTKTHKHRIVELNSRAVAVIKRQKGKTHAIGAEVFFNPTTKKPWHDDQGQRVDFKKALAECGVRYRPPKECRDTSVTMSLMAGCDPTWVADQHGHNVMTMLRNYAKWIPNGDGNRNLNRVNAAMSDAKHSADSQALGTRIC